MVFVGISCDDGRQGLQCQHRLCHWLIALGLLQVTSALCVFVSPCILPIQYIVALTGHYHANAIPTLCSSRVADFASYATGWDIFSMTVSAVLYLYVHIWIIRNHQDVIARGSHTLVLTNAGTNVKYGAVTIIDHDDIGL